MTFKTWRSPIVWVSLLCLVYIVTRLIQLTALPIFTDEAIYIRWSQIGGNDAAWRFISLTDGKQPLFTWFVMAALRFFKDPLVAGRMVSVVAGFCSIWGLFLLGSEIFKNKRIGVLASFLYLISPFTLIYDRMALYDAWVAAFSIWNLYLAVLLVRRVRLDVALILGLTLGIGMLNKTSAFFSLYLLPATIVLFDFKQKRIKTQLIKWIGLCLLAAVLSQVVYSILRLSPFFYIIAQKDVTFIYSFDEWITHPFRFIQGNLHGEFDWIIHYLTFPIFFSALFQLLSIYKKPKEKILLFIWWFTPFLGLATFGKVLYPRFVLFMVMPLFILAANTFNMILDNVRFKLLGYIIIGLLSIQAIGLSGWVLLDIKTAPIPQSDVGQYIVDWPSGWGTNELVTFFKNEAKDKPIAIYTEGTFGLYPFALEIYLWQDKNIEIHGFWPPPPTLPPDMEKSAREKPTFLVVYQNQKKFNWPITLITRYQKGINKDVYVYLYKVELPK